jgi:hypothetical protein
MYINGKMIPVKTIPGMGGGKNICKCYSVPPPCTTVKK